MTAIFQFTGFVKSEPLEHIARNTRREYVRFTARERDRGQARTWVVFALRHDTIQAARDLRVGDAVSISGSPRFRIIKSEGDRQALLFEIDAKTIQKLEAVGNAFEKGPRDD